MPGHLILSQVMVVDQLIRSCGVIGFCFQHMAGRLVLTLTSGPKSILCSRHQQKLCGAAADVQSLCL